jgi:hypothetical protein
MSMYLNFASAPAVLIQLFLEHGQGSDDAQRGGAVSP